jgi:Domain of unknown function (DUF6250)
MKKKSCAIVFLLLFVAVHAQVLGPREENQHQTTNELSYKRGKLLYKDDFNNGLKNWVIETPSGPGSTVTVKEKKMLIDVDGGATIWLNRKLSGNLVITYNRKVIVDTGRNDRLSDLNQFWMAIDPRNENLFTRSGIFSEYDSLLLYYAGFGGNSNTTTRFRKYTGNGERVLLCERTDKEHLLEPNKRYSIKIVVYDGLSKFFVDGKEFFSFRDANSIAEGYFGFRTTQSRQEIDDFKIYRLK